MHLLYRWLTKLHFTGAVPAPLYRALHAHMKDCAGCREHFARHLEWEALLPDAELSAGERMWRQAVALEAGRADGRARAAWGFSLAGAAAAAAVLLLTLRSPEQPTGLQARGEAETKIELLTSRAGQVSFVRSSELETGGELAFTLDNAEGYAFLNLVILDARGEVHLLYPARGGESGLPIGGYPPGARLPDAFSPALPIGSAWVVVHFSHDPRPVDEVEAALRAGGVAEAQRQLAPRGRLQLLTLQVEGVDVEDGGDR